MKKVYCSVPGCKNIKNNNINSKVIFHTFPKDNDRRVLWSKRLNITKNVTSNMFICSHHFKESDYFLKIVQSSGNNCLYQCIFCVQPCFILVKLSCRGDNPFLNWN